MSDEIFNLEGKTAIVTGATGLLGKEHCKALASAGANIVVLDLDDAKCNDFASTLPTKSIGIASDITNPESIKNARDRILNEFRSIDILVNNAAINDMVENPISMLESSKFENYPLELFRKVMDVNVAGTFLCSQIFGQEMLMQNQGSIINIASTYGIVAPDQSLYQDENGNQQFYKSPVYPASKGAIIAFTRFLAAYWGEKGIRVNSLTPGGVENNQSETFIKKYSERTPLKSKAQSNDYLGAIIYLASDASKYVTGANIIVDGGWTIW
jgi:NAD(P)-dependent dehydrogenase (short-subunit alcohol dehydrogenase family)